MREWLIGVIACWGLVLTPALLLAADDTIYCDCALGSGGDGSVGNPYGDWSDCIGALTDGEADTINAKGTCSEAITISVSGKNSTSHHTIQNWSGSGYTHPTNQRARVFGLGGAHQPYVPVYSCSCTVNDDCIGKGGTGICDAGTCGGCTPKGCASYTNDYFSSEVTATPIKAVDGRYYIAASATYPSIHSLYNRNYWMDVEFEQVGRGVTQALYCACSTDGDCVGKGGSETCVVGTCDGCTETVRGKITLQ